MKVLKGTILLFIVLFIATAAFSETGEAGPAMLKMMYGARLMSLGGAFVGLADDPFYMDSNPAGGQSETYRISIIHQEWIEDVNHESLRFTLGFDSLFMGIGYTFLYNKFEHYDYYGEEAGEYNLSQGFGTFNIGYIFNGLSVGTNLKFYHYNVPEELYAGQNEYVVAADLGVLYRTDILKTFIGPEPSMVFGASIKNVGKSLGSGFEKLPSEVHLGASYRLSWLMLSTELVVPFYEPIYGSVGLEYNFRQTIFASAGITIKENPMLGMGIGVRWKDLYVYGSYTPRMEFRNMFNVSLSYRFGETKRLENDKLVAQLISEATKAYIAHDYESALEIINRVLIIDRNNKIAKALKRNIETEMDLERRLQQEKIEEIGRITDEYEKKINELISDFKKSQDDVIANLQSEFKDEKQEYGEELSKELSEGLSDEFDKKNKELESELAKNEKDFEQQMKELRDRLENDKRAEFEELEKIELVKSEHYSEGLKLITNNQYEEALIEFEKITGYDKNYLKTNEYIKVAKAGMKNPESYSKEVLNQYFIGMDLFTEKKYAEAVEAWKKVLEIDPYNKLARQGIREANQRLRNIDKI